MRWTRSASALHGMAGQVLWACERSNGARTNDAACGRRSRVVLTPRRWRQGGGRRAGPTGSQACNFAGDGDNQARSPGRSRRKPLKPLRAGTPGEPAYLRSNSRAFYLCTRGRGCGEHPAFPTPSILGGFVAKTRAHGVAGTRACVCTPETHLSSSPRRRGPITPGVDDERGSLPHR
jgi:hypothetical protein